MAVNLYGKNIQFKQLCFLRYIQEHKTNTSSTHNQNSPVLINRNKSIQSNHSNNSTTRANIMTEHQETPKTSDNNNLDTTNYNQILTDIRSILQKGVSKAYKAVDNLRVQTYWQIGERIVRDELEHKQRADYGKEIIKNLAIDLNLAKPTLRHMIRFYREYPILSTVWRELSWSHYRIIMYIKNKDERHFYEQQILLNMWSARELERQIKNNLYRHKKKEETPPIIQPRPTKPIQPEQIFKDTYNFDFLNRTKNKHTQGRTAY